MGRVRGKGRGVWLDNDLSLKGGPIDSGPHLLVWPCENLGVKGRGGRRPSKQWGCLRTGDGPGRDCWLHAFGNWQE
jgi:hypothetical protein